MPRWLTVNYLGNPDNGVIVAAYIGSWLMGGAFLAISICISALTRNQVVAFIVAVIMCAVFVVSGFEMVLDIFRSWASNTIIDTVASLSFLTHFDTMSRGVLAADDIVYFLLVITVWLYACSIIVDENRAA